MTAGYLFPPIRQRPLNLSLPESTISHPTAFVFKTLAPFSWRAKGPPHRGETFSTSVKILQRICKDLIYFPFEAAAWEFSGKHFSKPLILCYSHFEVQGKLIQSKRKTWKRKSSFPTLNERSGYRNPLYSASWFSLNHNPLIWGGEG